MFNIGLFELLFFLGFALIFLGPEKLIKLFKASYQFYHQFKSLFRHLQTDLERELKLDQLQRTLETEISKIHALELRLHEKINAQSHDSLPYQLLPYFYHQEILALKPLSNTMTYHHFLPHSYSFLNFKFGQFYESKQKY
ncbi:hypothetical protein HX005_15420 [Acinetobacter sp. R933-2]|uniref:hypothetical protein n=1 Tax=Acinetobacter sp. R933-2 TaxID=2746728 RepID=UPI002577197B|nr:hypothetical protein [Acinetobacter sp. R933-2]MDM1248778.1 hypothetical protein [Acinetobacter sp. R933-2]